MVEYIHNELTVDEVGEKILRLLQENNEMTINQLYEKVEATETEIDESIRILSKKQYLGEKSDWSFFLSISGEEHLKS